jgi:hypothetical protein
MYPQYTEAVLLILEINIDFFPNSVKQIVFVMKLRGASCGGGAEFSHFYFSGSHPVACIG